MYCASALGLCSDTNFFFFGKPLKKPGLPTICGHASALKTWLFIKKTVVVFVNKWNNYLIINLKWTEIYLSWRSAYPDNATTFIFKLIMNYCFLFDIKRKKTTYFVSCSISSSDNNWDIFFYFFFLLRGPQFYVGVVFSWSHLTCSYLSVSVEQWYAKKYTSAVRGMLERF